MATNRDLLKEAIADAKAVKEMAIANAKTALEEAFTPRLKEMLSAKIQEMDKEDDDVKEMMYDEDDDSKKMEEEMKYEEDDSKMEEAMEYEEDDSKMEEAMYDEDDSVDEMNLEELLAELEEEEKGEEKVDEGKKSDEDKEDVKEGMYEEDDDMADDDMDEEGEPLDLEDMTDEDLKKMIEDVIADMIDSGELEAGEGAEEEGEEEEMSDEEEEVDLTELLKEIETEMNEEKEEKEKINELDPLSGLAIGAAGAAGIGAISAGLVKLGEYVEDLPMDHPLKKIQNSLRALGKAAADAKRGSMEEGKESLNEIDPITGLAIGAAGAAGIGAISAGLAKLEDYVEKLPDDNAAKKVLMSLRALGKAAGDAKRGSMEEGKDDLKKELDEAKAEIKSLKSELNEAVKTTNATNLLNAKLLYTNKIFKSKNLNESQKVKVLSSFDKANTVKESKLIYETLNEGLKTKKSNIKENLGRASKATTVPTTKKPIVESNDVFARMQKLAGIK